MKVECRTDADHHGVDLAAVFGHPAFLFRAAQADPDGAGAAVVDLLGQGGVLFFRERSEGRRHRAGDAQGGPGRAQAGLELVQRVGCASQQEDAFAVRGRVGAVVQHQVRAADARLVACAELAHHPGDGCPVGGAQVGGQQGLLVPPVLSSGHQRVRVADADSLAESLARPGRDQFDSLLRLDHVHRNAKDRQRVRVLRIGVVRGHRRRVS